MTLLNTKYPTLVFQSMPLIDPSTIKQIMEKRKKKHERADFYYKKTNPTLQFVVDIASGLLRMYGFNHNKEIWYMDCIRYKLDNETKGVDSSLAWHCENDNYGNLITVLFYLRKDETIRDGGLLYKDKDNKTNLIEVNSGMTIIMDGRVQHKPQNPYGSGKRELIIVSFRQIY